MRSIKLTAFSVFLAASLAAQTPQRTSTVPPVRQTLGFDIAGLVDERPRAGMEALVFGRWTVGIGASFTSQFNQDFYGYPYPVPLGVRGGIEPATGTAIMPPCYPGEPCPPYYYPDNPEYRAWSFDLSARYYPAALSFSNPNHKLMIYLGEFIGYHSRRIKWQNTCYYCYYVGDAPVPEDSLFFAPPNQSIYPGPGFIQRLHGFEPGAELGVRLMPVPTVFIDVGGWFKLVTIQDPLLRDQPGDVDARLVVAVGIGW